MEHFPPDARIDDATVTEIGEVEGRALCVRFQKIAYLKRAIATGDGAGIAAISDDICHSFITELEPWDRARKAVNEQLLEDEWAPPVDFKRLERGLAQTLTRVFDGMEAERSTINHFCSHILGVDNADLISAAITRSQTEAQAHDTTAGSTSHSFGDANARV